MRFPFNAPCTGTSAPRYPSRAIGYFCAANDVEAVAEARLFLAEISGTTMAMKPIAH